VSYNPSSAYLSSLIYMEDQVNANTNGASFADPSGQTWQQQAFTSDDQTGYQGAVFVNVKTNAVVLVNRGTEPSSYRDLASDLQMGVGKLPQQYASASNLFDEAKKVANSIGAPQSSILITGHSLGGSLAELLGAKYSNPTETFNPYGVGNLLSQLGLRPGTYDNIVNHVTEADPVSVAPGSQMLGSTYAYITPADASMAALSRDGKEAPLSLALFLEYLLKAHSIDNFGDISLSAQSGRAVSIDVPSLITAQIALDAWCRDLGKGFLQFSFGLGSTINGIENSVATLFTAAQSYQRQNVATLVWVRRDPLILDLDGDGLETHGIDAAHPIYFDHTGDGTLNPSGWVAADDGILVLDRNGNGQIDDGTELFGDSTPLSQGGQALNGFQALAQEDSNEDGWVDAKDARFGELRVWRDLNQNGVSEAGELLTLESLGIQGFRVEATPNYQLLDNGNVLADVGSYLRTDGNRADMGMAEHLGDVDLASDPFHRRFDDAIPLTEQTRALPEMQGRGQVRDLREAASLSPELTELLVLYAAAPNRAGQRALLDQLLEAWADTSEMAPTAWIDWQRIALPAAGENTSGMVQVTRMLPEQLTGLSREQWEKLTLLERFNGRRADFLSGVHMNNTTTGLSAYGGQIALLELAYASLRESVYINLALQTRLQPALNSIVLRIEGTTMGLDFSAMERWLNERLAANLTDGLSDVVDLVKGVGIAHWNELSWQAEEYVEQALETYQYAPDFSAALLANGFLHASDSADLLDGSGNSDDISGGHGANNIAAGAGDDLVFGLDGNDVIRGEAGKDQLAGGNGDDLIKGGNGNDILNGGNGNDVLDGGGGHDSLDGGAGNDTYLFGKGDGQDVILFDYDPSDDKANVLQFKDGVSPSEVVASRWGNDLVLSITGTSDRVTAQYFFLGDEPSNAHNPVQWVRFADDTAWNPDILKARAQVQTGTNGRDWLYGFAWDDVINAVNGDDTIYGRDGNDQLRGGEGSDSLYGEGGNDHLGGGNGNDILNGGNGNDWLTGGAGADQIDGGDGTDTAAYGASALGVAVSLVEGQGHGGDAEGDVITGIENLSGSAHADQLIGDAGNNSLNGQAGDDLLMGNAGNDWLTGGPGADQIDGGDGKDTAAYGASALGVAVSLVEGRGHGGDAEGDVLTGIENLSGSAHADQLIGDAGNNSLNGQAGDDLLMGNAGNDWINGGLGDDVYWFDRGDGADTWVDNDTTVGNLDIARFGSAIDFDQLWFRKSGNNLDVRVIGTMDRVLVKDWYVDEGHHIERFEAGGKALLDSQVDALVQAMAAFSPPAAGQTTLPDNTRQALAPVLAANWQ